ncbi:MAG: DNA topoisomerase 3 [Bacteroidetes bacterium]|nr:DNA topoisomerase 3 [Bacteroidota bacterium]
MILCIAEKPSVGKEIARILGATNRRDGFYEGNNYLISWTFGHLCTLKAPDDYSDDWKRWDLNFLPMIPPKFQLKVIDNSGVTKQFNTLKSLIEQCSEVVNCGDAGIEGELIQRWVLAKASNNKPVKRLWISSMTDEAIKEGFENLKDSKDYDLLYAAGNARAIGDWLLGMNASRLYTVKYANGKGVLSIGRVQTPTLALIVNRYHEIQNFKPEIYWELKTTYRAVVFNSAKRKFTKKEDASQLLESIKNHLFEIVSSTKKNANESPLPLFDLTSLQVECNKKLNFTADDTLKNLQKLYESKLVTYPRVDTTYLPENMYPKIKGILENMKPYEQFTKVLLDKPIRKSKKVFDDKKITDHHAIIPTGVMPPSGMYLPEKQVYDIIARRFIAAFYPDCVVSNTVVLGDVDGNEFSATGKVILEEGWRILYPKKDTANGDDKEKEDEEQLMPLFVKGEKGEHTPDLQEKQTQPPKMHTEATLLRAMETAGKQVDDPELRDLMKENGIGRPSTRANIIETLFKRNYITRQRKNLVPTITGIQLIKTINNELLKSVELTGIWEKKLRQIEKGEYDPHLFLTEMKDMVSDLTKEVKSEFGNSITIEAEKKQDTAVTSGAAGKSVASDQKTKSDTKPAKEIPLTCPKCGKGQMIKGKTAFGCSHFKEGCSFRINFEFGEKKLSDKQIQALIQKKKTPSIKGFTIHHKKVNGHLILNNDFGIELIEETEKSKASLTSATPVSNTITEGQTCPKCKQGVILKGKTAYGCNRFKEGCDFRVLF